jgi:hypothetical protein
MAISLQEWTDLVRREYLAEFVASGGAAVKLAVAAPEEVPRVMDALEQLARSEGYVPARVSAAQTRVHSVDRIFHAVARQVEWDDAADRYLRGLLGEHGIVGIDGRALHEMDAIADANDRLKSDLYAEIGRLITHRVLENRALAREFRAAVAMLCWSRINPQNVSPSDAEIVHQWLVGERCSMAALKRMQIYQRIARHNARWVLVSLARWLREIGHSGLVLLLDLSAAVAVSPPDAESLRYTRTGLLDTYEVLRQFIDETDEMEHMMVVAVAGPGLLEDPRRSVDNYTALKMRTSDEVRDRSRANPLSALVRLDAAVMP